MKSRTAKNSGLYLWRFSLTVLCFFFSGPGIAGAGAGDPSVITALEARRMMGERGDIVFINTMSAIECRDHRIPGSVCIPCPAFEKEVPQIIQNKNRPLVLYCASIGCHRSMHAARKALDLGYRNVFVLDGGLPAWKEADYSVESERRIPRTGIASIKPKALSRWVAEKTDILILDIRSRDLFDTEHIPGAINYPLDELEGTYRELPMDKRIVVVDEQGHRSFLAACYLYERGLVDIQRLFGGMQDWRSFMQREE